MRDFILVFLTFVTLPIVGCGGSGVNTKPPTPLAVQTNSLPSGVVGTAYSAMLRCWRQSSPHGLRRLVLPLRDWNSAQALAQLRGRPRRMGHRVTSCFG